MEKEWIDVRLYAPLATCLAIIVTVTLWILNQRRKELTYKILCQDPLTNVRGSARTKLDITYSGTNVRDCQLVLIQVENSGHLPINPGDYQSHIKITVPPGGNVLFADIAETMPADLEDRCLKNGQRQPLIAATMKDGVELTPVLLNDGDSLTVQLVVQSLRGPARVAGHIQGIRSIRRWRESRLVPTLLTHAGVLCMAIATLTVEPSHVLKYGFELAVPFIMLFFLGYTLLTSGIHLNQRIDRTLTPGLDM